MEHVWLSVMGITALLAIAVAMLPAAKRLNFPYTVLLAILGVFIGVIGAAIEEAPGLSIVGDFFVALRHFEISSEAILFIFLPALVFESALAIDVRRLLDDIAPILILAIIGLLISTFVVGYSLWAVSGMAMVACLLLGAIVSATDPVAVVAIFKDLGAPKRLAILVEGESLFNDATAIVIFTILAALLIDGGEPDFLSGVLSFITVFTGGIVVGYLMAHAVCFVIARLKNYPLVEITLTISLAYLSFIVAEHYLHVSGVMAVVTAALVVGSSGRTSISSNAWHLLEETWEQIGFWANSLIFVLVGIMVPKILSDVSTADLGYLLVLLAAAFAARAAVLYGLFPVLQLIGLSDPVTTRYRTVMFWGGLRGAVSLALALIIIENPAVPAEIKNFIGVLVTAFVLFTLFINATTIKPVMALLGLDKLSTADLAIRDRAMALSLTQIGEAIENAAAEYRVDAEISHQVVKDYTNRARQTNTQFTEASGEVNKEDWLRIGLAALANQERRFYLSYHASGYVSPPLARLLLGQIDDILDGIKANGLDGYHIAVNTNLGFDWRFRAALRMQRHFGWARPLTHLLVNRFELLLATIAALNSTWIKGLPAVTEVVGEDVGRRLQEILDQRIDQTNEAFEALELQYPEYSKTLQECHLQRIALRLEENAYQSMYNQDIIGKEVLADLEDTLNERARKVDRLPQLDLGLKPAQLIATVPLFKDLDASRIEQIAKLLKPRLSVPGEHIIHKGDTGDAMYFITSGAVEVDLEPEPFSLGSGEFFGEIALVNDHPRTTDVRTKSFCDLLVLYKRDFNTLLASNPEMRQAIHLVSDERAGLGAKEQ